MERRKSASPLSMEVFLERLQASGLGSCFTPTQLERAGILSLGLFADSKRIEALLPLARRFSERARRCGSSDPDFSILERSWPETAIAGDIVLHFRDGNSWRLGGAIIGLPLSTVNRIESIESPYGLNTALSIENKESFHTLSLRPNGF
jgi:hypothetical protein